MSAVMKGRVLFIDDEPHVLRALEWLLQREFEVHTCERPADALRLLHRHDFDVVVSDQRMPGITGVELLRHVRKLAPRAMRILLTGYSDLDAMVKSVNESEVYRFVTKPWDVRALPKLIAEAAEVARTGPVVLEDQVPSAANDSSAAAAPAANDVTAAAPHAPEALLVIDDRPELHTQVPEALGPTVEVLHAYDLPSAVALLDSRPIAVVVSEVKVGGRDATRLVRMLKAAHPEIVSLVVSGLKDAMTVLTLINQGQVYRIVPKPVKSGSLRLLVDSALSRHRQLIASPGFKRRFAVEPTAQGVADSLYRDIMAVPPAASSQAPSPAGLIDNLKAGFRRLFGTAQG